MDQMKTSKESWAPAETTSPLQSTATQENWVGRGDVKVRKFRYLPEDGSPVGTAHEAPPPRVPGARELGLALSLSILRDCRRAHGPSAPLSRPPRETAEREDHL